MVTVPKRFLLLVAATATLISLSLPWLKSLEGQEREWRQAHPDYAWSFPKDHWARRGYQSQWWYFSGHLTSIEDPRQRFGYQFTFFRWGDGIKVEGHAAISDLTAGRHLFSVLARPNVPPWGGFGRYPDPLIAWSRPPAGSDGKWTLRWNGEAFDFTMQDDAQRMAFQLSTRPAKPLIFQGPNGYSKKSESSTAASLYYSFTRLRTEGTISLDGKTVEVRGESWMDREFFSHFLGEYQEGWDWFSLQLDDGREIMAYLLRLKAGGIDIAHSTLVTPEGKARYLAREEWTVRATRTWKSPKTGVEFPSRWILEYPGENLRMEIVPELADQENRTRTGASYWEGAVTVQAPGGQKLGHGYVELVGYRMKNRPPGSTKAQ